MPFREKKAWVTIFALIIVFFPYYLFMIQAYHQPDPHMHYLMHLAAIALSAFVVLEVILVLAARKFSPEDAGIPKDERDQLFAFRAARAAYVSLIILLIVVSFLMIHTHGGNWGWGMSYLAAILLSEILRASVLIVQYRRNN
ncbi:MAG: hypothetical protein COC19_06005 [SAR86 cluster bacterium]|uniref:DUF2178 domain-containing protein n=1 Tax=SAR86 cluster bacterium TaxID=2030880 RepID=A0A2A4MKU4_9GAMM|nr:MAG: hypothetical protein COC19_06005 [SAR86 cluster bacterium]